MLRGLLRSRVALESITRATVARRIASPLVASRAPFAVINRTLSAAAPNLAVAEEADVGSGAAGDAQLPSRFTSEMRPPGDTSRKWVKIDGFGRAYAVGRRKTAVAQVWVRENEGDELAQIRINRQDLSSFFGGHWEARKAVLAPFFVTGTSGRYSVTASVKGGGINGELT